MSRSRHGRSLQRQTPRISCEGQIFCRLRGSSRVPEGCFGDPGGTRQTSRSRRSEHGRSLLLWRQTPKISCEGQNFCRSRDSATVDAEGAGRASESMGNETVSSQPGQRAWTLRTGPIPRTWYEGQRFCRSRSDPQKAWALLGSADALNLLDTPKRLRSRGSSRVPERYWEWPWSSETKSFKPSKLRWTLLAAADVSLRWKSSNSTFVDHRLRVSRATIGTISTNARVISRRLPQQRTPRIVGYRSLFWITSQHERSLPVPAGIRCAPLLLKSAKALCTSISRSGLRKKRRNDAAPGSRTVSRPKIRESLGPGQRAGTLLVAADAESLRRPNLLSIPRQRHGDSEGAG